MSTLSYLRWRLGIAQKRLARLDAVDASALKVRDAGVEVLNLTAALRREEKRLLDADSKL